MRLEARSIALAIAGVACAIAAVVGAACIVVPPQDLPQEPQRPPLILRASAIPPPDTLIITLPANISVSVDPENPDNPSAAPNYRVFVDGLPYTSVRPAFAPNDAGLSLISFTIFPQSVVPPLDPTVCHRIDLLVARSFAPMSFIADAPGSDSVAWRYASPNAPYGCLFSSADGQAPPPDAADGPFTPPSEGGGLDP